MSILHNQEVHLIDYLRVVYKRRVFLVVVLAVALLGAAWSTSKQQPIFASTARVMMDNEATLVDFPGVERRSQLRIDTEMHIMRSREVAEHAVLTELRPGSDRSDPEFERLVAALLNATGVEVVRNTYILQMRILADSPENARDWCDAMSKAYVALNFDAKKQANSVAADAISEQIQATERELQQAERRLMEFKSENNMVSEQSKRTEQEQSFGAGTSARVASELKQVEYQNKYRTLSRWYQGNDFSGAVPPDLLPSTFVNELYGQIVKKKMEHVALLEKYHTKHPKAQAVASELKTLRDQFDQEVRNALAALKNSVELYGTITQDHSVRIESEKADFLKQNERDWMYKVLVRNVDAKDEMFKSLLQKLGELNVTTSIVRNNVRIVERPKLNPTQVRPNWNFNMLVGLAFGLAIGMSGVFFLEYLDKSLKTPDDVARYLALPVLAVVPLARSEFLRAPYQPPQVRETEGEPGAVPA